MVAEVATTQVNEQASGATNTCTTPTGASIGDLLVAFVAHGSATAPASPGGSWVTLGQAAAPGGQADSMSAFLLPLTGAPAASYAFTVADSPSSVALLRVTGADPTGTQDVAAQINTGAAVTSLTVSASTTVTDGALALGGMSIDSVSQQLSGPQEMTEVARNSAGIGKRLVVASDLRVAAGGIGARTWSTTGAATTWTGVRVYLRPAPVPASTVNVVRGVTSGSSGPNVTTTLSITVPAPRKVTPGDPMLVAITLREPPATLTGWRVPSGWTLVGSPAMGSGSAYWYRATYGIDVTGNSWTWDNGAGNATASRWAFNCVAFKGDIVGSFISGTAAAHSTTSSTDVPTPTITPGQTGFLVAVAGARITGPAVFTWPTGWNKVAGINSPTGASNASQSTAVYATLPAPDGTYSATPISSVAVVGNAWSGIAAFSGVSTLLSRATKVTPAATFTAKWAADSPAADTTYDFRTSRFEGYFWADAIFGFGTFADGSGGTTATAHQLNNVPFGIGKTAPATRPVVVGGVVTGDQPSTLTWNSMKYGSQIQDCLDGGNAASYCSSLIINNQNQDGDPRVYVAQGSWTVIDGLRTSNTHDGFGIYSATSTLADTGAVYLRNCWISGVHDDAIENDRGYLTLDVDDCLFEDVHAFISLRAGDTTGSPDASKTQTVRNTIIKHKARPGPSDKPTSFVGQGSVYKSQANSPPLVMENVIIGVDNLTSSGQADLPVFTGCSYSNVTVVWLGSGAYPGNAPTGVTVTTDRTVLDNAVSLWKARHGVTNFDTVDMNRMLTPTTGAPTVTYIQRVADGAAALGPTSLMVGNRAASRVYAGATQVWP